VKKMQEGHTRQGGLLRMNKAHPICLTIAGGGIMGWSAGPVEVIVVTGNRGVPIKGLGIRKKNGRIWSTKVAYVSEVERVFNCRLAKKKKGSVHWTDKEGRLRKRGDSGYFATPSGVTGAKRRSGGGCPRVLLRTSPLPYTLGEHRKEGTRMNSEKKKKTGGALWSIPQR